MMDVLVRCDSYHRLATHFSDRPAPSLNDVVDPEQVMSDGFTLEGRMQKLCKGAANDITECVRTCREYLE